jgi:hypothetical protein
MPTRVAAQHLARHLLPPRLNRGDREHGRVVVDADATKPWLAATSFERQVGDRAVLAGSLRVPVPAFELGVRASCAAEERSF